MIIPALYSVLRLEEKAIQSYYPPDLLGMCTWLFNRTNEVLAVLVIHATPNTVNDIDPGDTDWKQVGRCRPFHCSAN